VVAGIGRAGWVEVLAFLRKRKDTPSADGTLFLPTDEDRPAGTGGIRRKTTIITSFYVGHEFSPLLAVRIVLFSMGNV
jgi:hypothetical protein